MSGRADITTIFNASFFTLHLPFLPWRVRSRATHAHVEEKRKSTWRVPDMRIRQFLHNSSPHFQTVSSIERVFGWSKIAASRRRADLTVNTGKHGHHINQRSPQRSVDPTFPPARRLVPDSWRSSATHAETLPVPPAHQGRGQRSISFAPKIRNEKGIMDTWLTNHWTACNACFEIDTEENSILTA